MSQSRVVSHPAAPLTTYRDTFCKRCLKKDTCYGDRELERNCMQAALLNELVFDRRQRREVRVY